MTLLHKQMTPAFWKSPEGAMLWTNKGQANEALLIRPPGLNVVALIHSHRAENNWAEVGDINGFDGNYKSPTFKPSIENTEPYWHGFVSHGRFTSEVCECATHVDWTP